MRPIAAGRIEQAGTQPPTRQQPLIRYLQPAQNFLIPARRQQVSLRIGQQSPSDPHGASHQQKSADGKSPFEFIGDVTHEPQAEDGADRDGDVEKRHEERRKKRVVVPRRRIHDPISEKHGASQKRESPTA